MSEKERGNPQGAASATGQTKKRGVSRFLALLGNCCRSDDNANTVDTPEPSKKVTKVKPTQNSLPVPKDAGHAESGTTDSKATEEPEASMERNREPIVASQTPMTTAQQLNEKAVPDLPMATVPLMFAEKPLPASPPLDDTAVELQPVGAQTQRQGVSPPMITTSEAPITAQEAEVRTDRTPAQKAIDEDLEMNDAAPHIPLTSYEVPTLDQEHTTNHGTAVTQVDIAPAPPASERQLQPTVLAGPAPLAAIAAREEYVQPTDRKWLLPPVSTEHKRRKCLVLDLDETLVHSSFKVDVLSHTVEHQR